MNLAIRNGKAYQDDQPVEWAPTNNKGGRIEPRIIVVHGTASRIEKGSAVSWLQNPKSRVSAHFVIERDGTIVQMVDCNLKSWHCDPSEWNGIKNCNNFSIGIELVEPGRLRKVNSTTLTAWYKSSWPIDEAEEIDSPQHNKPGFWWRFEPAQIEACRALVTALAAAYTTIEDVVAHYEIAPGRKEDPSPTFPMADLKAILADRIPMEHVEVANSQARLNSLGYGAGPEDGLPGPRYRGALRTFQEQNGVPITGQLDQGTATALYSQGAAPMPSPAREDATKKELKDSGSGIMSDASKVKRGTEIGGGLEIVNSVGDAQAGLGKVLQAKSFGEGVSSLVTWVTTPAGFKTIAIVALLAFVWFGANRIEWRRLRDHVRGLAIGR